MSVSVIVGAAADGESVGMPRGRESTTILSRIFYQIFILSCAEGLQFAHFFNILERFCFFAEAK